MKTARTDIKRDKRQTKLVYGTCSMLGFSRLTLKPGDTFIYKEYYTDGTFGQRLAKCHGRVKPNDSSQWMILAQAADDMMKYTFERWITPEDVIETLPAERVNPAIAQFFLDTEEK